MIISEVPRVTGKFFVQRKVMTNRQRAVLAFTSLTLVGCGSESIPKYNIDITKQCSNQTGEACMNKIESDLNEVSVTLIAHAVVEVATNAIKTGERPTEKAIDQTLERIAREAIFGKQ